MKKIIIKASIFGFAMAFSVACTKDEIKVQPETEKSYETVTLTAGVPTKVFSNGNEMKWNASKDSIKVFDADRNSYHFLKAAGESATSASFSGKVLAETTLEYAAYPTSGSKMKNDVLTMYLSTSQVCDAYNSVPHKTPLFGVVSSENTVTMKNPCAFLKVNLPQEDTSYVEIFDSLKVTAANCCGKFTVNLSGISPIVSKGDKNTISISPRKKRSGYVYIPVLPGSYDEMTIELLYTEEGRTAFSRTSTTTQTFESGLTYDVKEFCGPYVESTTTGNASISGTTLSMTGSAKCWKYSGVTNSDYTFQFLYKEDGASDWTPVSGSNITGDASEVSFDASVSGVDPEKTYIVKAKVTGSNISKEGDEVTCSLNVTKEFDFTTAPTDFTYSTLKSGKNNGYKKIVDSDGNPVFPTFSPSSAKAKYYYQAWDATNATYGATTYIEGTLPAGQTGIIVRNGEYSITISSVSKYYTVSSSLFCVCANMPIKLNCPDGYKITKVGIKVAANKTCTWGIGSASYYEDPSTIDISAFTDYKDTDNPVDVTIDISAKTKANTSYYFISGVNYNRLGKLTVTYQKQ